MTQGATGTVSGAKGDPSWAAQATLSGWAGAALPRGSKGHAPFCPGHSYSLQVKAMSFNQSTYVNFISAGTAA